MMGAEFNQKEWLCELLRKRRTRKPSSFHSEVCPKLVSNLIELARHAPNHHRTEPARFYLLDRYRINLVGNLFAEVLSGNGKDPAGLEKAKRKKKEWGDSPGLLVITSHCDKNSILARKNPQLERENYATVCCIVQNLLLLFEAFGISSKWSTGNVWEHESFSSAIGVLEPDHESPVALLFYGYGDFETQYRTLSPLVNHMMNYQENFEKGYDHQVS